MRDPKIPRLAPFCATLSTKRQRRMGHCQSMRRRTAPLVPMLSAVITLLCLDVRLPAAGAFQPSTASRLRVANTYVRDHCFFAISSDGPCLPSRIRPLFSSSTEIPTETSTQVSDEQQDDDSVTIVPSAESNGGISGAESPSLVNGASNQTTTNGATNDNLDNNEVPDVPLPTANGGYSHTTASRAKISAANKGKVPWNKGRQRSPEEKARIAAGVRAKNRQRFLEKLEAMGVTEEEYNEQKKAERRKKDAERRARKTANGGYRPTEKTKQKISAILKEKWAKGEMKKRAVDPSKVRRGFTHSEETRAKISASLKKRWANDPEYRDKMQQKSNSSNSSEEVKQRISATLKERWKDPEFRRDMMEKMAARRQATGPKEVSHREKISAAMKKKWQDQEYRSKALAGIQKRRNADRPKSAVVRSKPVVAKAATPRKASDAAPRGVSMATTDGIQLVKPVQPKRNGAVKPARLKAASTNVRAPKAVQPKRAAKKSTTTKKRATKRATSKKQMPKTTSIIDTNAELLAIEAEKARAEAIKAEPDGSINRLREERRDLYDLLYGEDASATSLDLGDENLDTFDPYGLEDF